MPIQSPRQMYQKPTNAVHVLKTHHFNTYALKVRFTRGTEMYRTGAGAIHCPSGVARAFAFALPRRRDVFSCFA